MMSYKLEDTEQTKRMKGLALGGAYFNCGDIYKLLEYRELHNLVKKIKNGSIRLKSKLIYNKLEITNEEKFLENLDNYIIYAKNNYKIDCVEQFLLIEMGLDNKYADKCLLLLDDFHSEDNYLKYFNYFRRMFLYNIYNNILYYHSKDKFKECKSIEKAYNQIKKYNFDDDEDILKIEKMFKDILKARNNNVCNACDSYKKIRKEEQLPFYLTQLEWVLSDYYSSVKNEEYKIKSTDNILETNTTKVLFNICSDYSKCKRKDSIVIDFGVFNNNVNSIAKGIELRKEEFDIIFEMLEDIVIKKGKYRDVIEFVDSTLKFDFDFEGTDRYLDIIYVLPNCGGDFYNISMGKKEIVKLYELLKKQLSK